MKKKILILISCFLLSAQLLYSQTDKRDFDNDGDVDAQDLYEFSLKYGTTIWFQDSDGDGYSSGESIYSGEQPQGYFPQESLVQTSGDCDDDNADVNQGADELCEDNIDNNCNGEVDEGCVPPDGTPCDDGIACTSDDVYNNGICSGIPDDSFCNDGTPCTIDVCDSVSGCIYEAAPGNLCMSPAGPCDTGGYCTDEATCDYGGLYPDGYNSGSCGPYLCNGISPDCPNYCDDNSDCASGYICGSNNVCEAE